MFLHNPQGIDVKSMGRIFIGLVKCGAWGCFDEFNRLEEAVLSAVSMQIQTIQAALKTKLPSTELLGRQVGVSRLSHRRRLLIRQPPLPRVFAALIPCPHLLFNNWVSLFLYPPTY